jgi:hypothetical protein
MSESFSVTKEGRWPRQLIGLAAVPPARGSFCYAMRCTALFGSRKHRNLSHMIDAYCGEVGLEARLCDGLTSRLITASRHRFGRAVETIINAIECALWQGATTLHLDHFADAWAMQEGCEPEANVFLSEHWLSLQIDKEADEYEQARTLRHRKKLERA